MPGGWVGSTRRARLPADWPKRRREVLERDNHTCQLRYPGCTGRATEVDHLHPGVDDHRISELQAACGFCHSRKSGREGNAAKSSRLRPAPVHPGAARAARARSPR